MAIQAKTLLKTYFETGDIPTQSEFEHLIDSLQYVNQRTVFSAEAEAIASVKWSGPTVPVWIKNGTGEYTLTVPTETEIHSFALNATSISTSSDELIINLVDTDGKTLFINGVTVIDKASNTQQPIESFGINPKQDPTTPGTNKVTFFNMGFANYRLFFSLL